jgi:glucokinase
MNPKTDSVLVLDAGGTNLVFNAVTNGTIMDQTYSLSADSENLEDLLKKIMHGFHEINKRTGENGVAISFCFPGPADFENGIIGDLENLPFFRGGVPLKKMLENEFKLPVFINNDGDLFTLGEAIGGLLPEINRKLQAKHVDKQYKNLLGVTLGTGFGGGIVTDGHLFLGDNSAGAEINRMADPFNWSRSIEETLSIRGLKRLFAEESGLLQDEVPEPYFIFRIGMGQEKGDRPAALKAWEKFSVTLAEALANATTLIDGLVVIGGGLSGAYHLFLPNAIELMNRNFNRSDGGQFPRMEINAFNLEDKQGLEAFLKYEKKVVNVPFSQEQQIYFSEKKTGIGITRLGTSHSVAIGAYAFAMEQLG